MKVAGNYQQNTPSFQMNIQCSNRTKKLLKNDLKRFYEQCVPDTRERFFGNEPFNFEKIFEAFKTQFRASTKDVDGTVILCANRKHNGGVVFFNTRYKQNGQILQSQNNVINGEEILADNLLGREPFSHAIKKIVAFVADTLDYAGYSDGENNKAAILFSQLMDSHQ